MSLSPQILLSNKVREKCVAKFKELPSYIQTENLSKPRAAVLVPLFTQNGEVHLLYTLRSSNLKNHSGQVSFPGGKVDENESLIETALRETHEEIGVPASSVDIWGEMPPMQGRDGNILITPVVGVIKDLDVKKLNPNIHEVAEIFSVSMSSFCNKNNHAHFKYNDIMLPVFLSGNHKIWGITGLITHMFLQCFLPKELYKVDFSRKKFTLDELLPSKL
ncbi:unnamed protein product [Danaus chrysippus]|uniref:(African queen) hypothetical protein n=1 Tax=Danaus chrysippus TaxID=151541 RepID=A0A8J2QM20_9NEOP|nr:unnamed protein product [Danaus chrysippus]